MKELNINNLLSFWRLAGSKVGSFHLSPGIRVSSVKNSDWPNRIWITSILNRQKLISAKEVIMDQRQHHRVSIFHEEDDAPTTLMSQFDFTHISSQTGMSLPLVQWTVTQLQDQVKLLPVTTRQEAEKWSETFKECFGYRISSNTVISLVEDASFFTIHYQNGIAGTAILYQTRDVAGIHGLGVLPSMRGKGIAKSTMEILLNDAKLKGLEIASLQASDRAFNMYKHLGFTEEFKMSNYQINKNENNRKS